jgi:hypothetical protein
MPPQIRFARNTRIFPDLEVIDNLLRETATVTLFHNSVTEASR